MAALIAVLAAAFLLLFYYTVVSRLCRSSRNRRRNRRALNPNSDDDDNIDTTRLDPMIHDPTRPATGLDESFIRQITVFKYRREDKLIEASDCAVCLSEFKEEESLRLMPNCEHAFHIPCIDTWLKSHSNCPLCRSDMNPVPPPVRPSNNPSSGAGGGGGGGGGGGVSVSVAAMQVQRWRNDVVLVIRDEYDGGDDDHEVVVCHGEEEEEEEEEEERESGEEEMMRKGEETGR